MAKFDPSGNLIWYNRFKLNPGWKEYPYFALTGPEEEICITGNVGVVSGGTTYHGLETVRYNSDGSNPWVAEVNQYAGIGKGLALGDDMSLYAVGMFYYSVIKYSQSTPTGVEQISEIPETFVLEQNYPNPFNLSTTISFSIPAAGFTSLKVYDVLGNEVATLVKEEKPAGNYEIHFRASSLSSGTYFYKIQAGSFSQSKKMILIK